MPLTDKMLSRKEGSVGYLIFNNPERHNAVSLEMWEAGAHYLEEFKNDKEVRVVVVTGAGGKAFVSGADISRFAKERSTKEAIDRYNVVVDQAYTAFSDFPKPTIAALNGHPDIKLVFTDVRMPGTRDGLDLARWVIENRPSIPVMIASGDLGRETAMRELCGVRAFVKPYDLEDVSMAVKAALAPRHRR